MIITGEKTKMKLNEAFEYSPVENHGIFYYLQNIEGIPWGALNIENQLDFYYHLNHSGNKITSPLIDNFIESGVISVTNREEIANIIYALFGSTWERMWQVYVSEYNPINNYDLTEHYEGEEETEHGTTETRTDNLTRTQTNNLTDTRTPDLTTTETHNTETETVNEVDETIAPETTKTTEKSVYGFNSADAEPSEVIAETDGGLTTRNTDTTDTVTNTGTITTDESGTDTTRRTGTVTDANTGTQATAVTGGDTRTNEHTLTRYGNIGVTTTQQMLQSEIALWQWNYFMNVIIPNIDGVLTIELY